MGTALLPLCFSTTSVDACPSEALLEYVLTPFHCDTLELPCPHSFQLSALRQQAHYYKAMHQRALQRQQQFQLQIEALNAQVRNLRQRMFGRRADICHPPNE